MQTPELREPLEVDVGDAVIGWRHWLLTRDRPELYSLGDDTLWIPRRTALASCPFGCGRLAVPNPSCTCGFHSTREPGDAPGATSSDCFLVPGRAAGWGKVVKGTRGWRTSKAYPDQIWLPVEAAHLAKPLEQEYGCSVKVGNPEGARR